MQLLFKLLALVVTISLAACSGRHTASSQYTINVNNYKHMSSFLNEEERTLPPFGYVDFCMRQPVECPEWQTIQRFASDYSPTASTSNVSPSKQSHLHSHRSRKDIMHRQYPQLSRSEILKQLQKINRMVNIAVSPVTDSEAFGVTENWRIPDISNFYGDIGDCEDYALLKRKILAQNGYDYNNLSMAVVRQKNGNIHAVLVVRTQYGDYVLDNLTKTVKPWDATNYAWIKKQSVKNPAIWVSIST